MEEKDRAERNVQWRRERERERAREKKKKKKQGIINDILIKILALIGVFFLLLDPMV